MFRNALGNNNGWAFISCCSFPSSRMPDTAILMCSGCRSCTDVTNQSQTYCGKLYAFQKHLVQFSSFDKVLSETKGLASDLRKDSRDAEEEFYGELQMDRVST